jgi:hypothetical protein
VVFNSGKTSRTEQQVLPGLQPHFQDQDGLKPYPARKPKAVESATPLLAVGPSPDLPKFNISILIDVHA